MRKINFVYEYDGILSYNGLLFNVFCLESDVCLVTIEKQVDRGVKI